ncbi:MAG TPA: ATP-dependent DNA ligase [Syntrophales bacterium]|nr:ATP-dependent DNA ligase [Syntrophales bacterium]
MKRFTELYFALEEATKTSQKVDALKRYFSEVPPDDAAWALYFLMGGKMKRLLPAAKLRQWSAVAAGIPEWLFDESCKAVGDLAETIALLLPRSAGPTPPGLRDMVEEKLPLLRDSDETSLRDTIFLTCQTMTEGQGYLWIKMITGDFRAGVSRQTVIRALCELAGLESTVISHRLIGPWEPTNKFFRWLLSPDRGDTDVSRPYPFHLPCPLGALPETLGDRSGWCAEWMWDGSRAQIVKRGGMAFIWSRAGELITGTFPELTGAAENLPDGTVIDGEILAWKDGSPLTFGLLQKRLGRPLPTRKLLEEIPVIFMGFDLPESQGRDIRAEPLKKRRAELERILKQPAFEEPFRLSEILADASWEDLTARRRHCRDVHVNGLMLKRLDSSYAAGRHQSWRKWKIEPHTIDAVLIYAQPGHGEWENLFIEYTFGLRRHGELIPVAKAHSGLTDEEIGRVDAFVRENTLEKFGPVRSVKPELVFEIAFEGIETSKRHKSGLTVRSPRIVKWKDKPPEEADTLESLKALLRKGSV